MTPEDRDRIINAIERYGPDKFFQAYISTHPKQAGRIQQIISRDGPAQAAKILFRYDISQPSVSRIPGSAMPSQANSVGAAQISEPAIDSSPGMSAPDIPATELPPMPMGNISQRQATIPQERQVPPISQLSQPIDPGSYSIGDPTMDLYGMFDYVSRTAKDAGVPLNLLMGMIKQESGFDPNAQSKAGAKGLVQLMANTARDRGLTVNNKFDERLDPVKNIEAALSQMQWIKDNYSPGTIESWLAAYNAGHTKLKNNQWMQMEEPAKYAKNVRKYSEEYKNDPALLAKDFMKMFRNIKGAN